MQKAKEIIEHVLDNKKDNLESSKIEIEQEVEQLEITLQLVRRNYPPTLNSCYRWGRY